MINNSFLLSLKKYISFKSVLLVFMFSLELYIIADAFVTLFLNLKLPSFFAPISFVLIFLLLISLKISCKRLIISFLIILLLFSIIVSVVWINYLSFKNDSVYAYLPNNNSVFANRRVMVMVPHQDDDLCVVGGMIDNYVANGSEVFPVFVTNGDNKGIMEERFKEAIKCWGKIGVPESHIYFLGYGDKWSDEGPHIYNSSGDRVCISAFGKNRTYGTESHPAFNDGVLYTYNNYKNDFKLIIKELKPDVMFVSDFDSHQDHKAVSLMFEKALGELLKEEKNYFPIVYKTYAYRTAWKANGDDYYSINAKKTREPEEEKNCPMVYNWKERIRFPLYSSNLSRSIFTSPFYEELSIYKSQRANIVAKNMINGDKVFWQRRTDSILYNAKIETSSGSSKCLNDFNILDSNNLKQFDHLPYDGVWTPEKSDKKQSISITLKQKSDISYIYLYDHPSMKTNIKKAKISFNNGDYIVADNINKNGSASKIEVNKKDVSSFTVSFIDYEGESPSVAEIEAFKNSAQKDDTFIKLTDKNDDFVYDYISGDITELSIYSNNSIPELSNENYSVFCDNKKCNSKIVNQKIKVYCPDNETCKITVSIKNTNISDTVLINNYNLIMDFRLYLGQKTEEKYVYPILKEGHLYDFTMYRFFHDLKLLF